MRTNVLILQEMLFNIRRKKESITFYKQKFYFFKKKRQ